MNENKDFKSGFITFVGRPNVGKSTLINCMVEEKVSAVSPKPNTTRNRIVGIKTYKNAQLIFLDTPGIHKAKTNLAKSMVKTARGSISEANIILFITDVDKPFGKGDKYIIENLFKPSVLVVNKIDKIRKNGILPILSTSNEYRDKFLEIIPISALRSEGIDVLTETLIRYLPYGPKYFPDDFYTDQPEVFLIAELIREKIFNLTHKEIPYKTAVKIEEFKENNKKNIIRIMANIYVERKNHKGIVVGKNGERLKKIGVEARTDIERIIGSKIFLELWVKVKENWTQNSHYIKEFVYGS